MLLHQSTLFAFSLASIKSNHLRLYLFVAFSIFFLHSFTSEGKRQKVQLVTKGKCFSFEELNNIATLCFDWCYIVIIWSFLIKYEFTFLFFSNFFFLMTKFKEAKKKSSRSNSFMEPLVFEDYIYIFFSKSLVTKIDRIIKSIKSISI